VEKKQGEEGGKGLIEGSHGQAMGGKSKKLGGGLKGKAG